MKHPFYGWVGFIVCLLIVHSCSMCSISYDMTKIRKAIEKRP